MSDQHLFPSTVHYQHYQQVHSVLEPGMYVTQYTTRNNDLQRSALKEIERELLGIPYHAKVKPVDKPLDNTQETLEEHNIYNSTTQGTSRHLSTQDILVKKNKHYFLRSSERS
uniref:Uncharacterized protein n=1 Tax=Cacopsylla melanoneura TaxID=428564 RepID=A0A8D8LWV6_9HEMI